MDAELMKKCIEAIERNRQLGIRPRMELVRTNGINKSTFDLRSLNTNLTKNKNVDQ